MLFRSLRQEALFLPAGLAARPMASPEERQFIDRVKGALEAFDMAWFKNSLPGGITPEGVSYGEIMETFKRAVRSGMKGMRLLSRVTTAMRLVYYDIVTEYLKTGRQVIPCYAAFLNVHVNSDGEVWPCAILAYRGRMGSVDDSNNFMDVWRSRRAREIRRSIRRKECACPLANQAYSNILLHPKSLLRVLWIALTG